MKNKLFKKIASVFIASTIALSATNGVPPTGFGGCPDSVRL